MGWSGCVTNQINHLWGGGVCLQHLIVLHKSRREANEVGRGHFLKMESWHLFLGFLNPPTNLHICGPWQVACPA